MLFDSCVQPKYKFSEDDALAVLCNTAYSLYIIFYCGYKLCPYLTSLDCLKEFLLLVKNRVPPGLVNGHKQSIFFNSYFKSPILAAGHLQRTCIENSVARILVAGDCQNHT